MWQAKKPKSSPKAATIPALVFVLCQLAKQRWHAYWRIKRLGIEARWANSPLLQFRYHILADKNLRLRWRLHARFFFQLGNAGARLVGEIAEIMRFRQRVQEAGVIIRIAIRRAAAERGSVFPCSRDDQPIGCFELRHEHAGEAGGHDHHRRLRSATLLQRVAQLRGPQDLVAEHDAVRRSVRAEIDEASIGSILHRAL